MAFINRKLDPGAAPPLRRHLAPCKFGWRGGLTDVTYFSAVRRRFEERFTSRRMAEDYLDVYRELTFEGRARLRVVG